MSQSLCCIGDAFCGSTDEDADIDDGDDEDHDDDLSGGGDEADCVDARSSSWYQGSRSVTLNDLLFNFLFLATLVAPDLTPVRKRASDSFGLA